MVCYLEVVFYIQAYAAAVMYSKDMRLRQLSKALIADIGGFTLDYLLLRYGEPDLEIFEELFGVVKDLYRAFSGPAGCSWLKRRCLLPITRWTV